MAETITGVGASPGTGLGPALRLVRSVPEPPAEQRHGGNATEETRRAMDALAATAAELETRGERAGGQARDVLSAQALMARDPALAEDVGRRVTAGATAARAVYDACVAFRDMLGQAGGYLAERVADLDDVRDRAVARILGVPLPGPPDTAHPFVLLARDLAPADTALLDPAKVVAFVTEEGTPTSHTAILARSLGLPAVVACESAGNIAEETRVLVDGGTGEVTIEPDEDTVARATAATSVRATEAARGHRPGATRDGHPVPLLANIGGPRDVPLALEHGAEGVGLYRTEFLFLDRADTPSTTEQVAAYRAVLEAFPGAAVVVRVLDSGADKPLAFLPTPRPEPNPALGERGIRLLRRHPEVLAGQLAALVRAAADTGARLRVMAPMVTDVDDAEWFAAAVTGAGIEDAGAMIEVPAAALRAHHIAEAVRFLSIGTNDLAQYACAADREIGTLSRLQDPWQPAVLDLVRATARAGAAADRPVGVCGEAAADPVLACVLAGLGVTSLSMSPVAIPPVRAALAAHTMERCERAAAAVSAARAAIEARRAAREELPGLGELGL